MEKTFKTTNAQMRLLRGRGLSIGGSAAKHILEKENYYNLINGYKSLFLDNAPPGSGEKYKAGAEFKEIYALFLFDRELRALFLRYILEIENNVRSVLSHDFSKKYGHDNYLKMENFDNTPKKISGIADLISNLHRELANQLRKNNPMVSHYISTYGYIPMWVLVNIVSFGTLSIFYSLLKQRDQNDIGKCFMLKPEDMVQYLKNLSLARNWCAHDERFFDNSLKARIPTCSIHAALGIRKDAFGVLEAGVSDIFSIVIILKQMLPQKTFERFFYALNDQIDQLTSALHSITIDDVRDKMGFPSNWTMIKDA
jgi:abortive infection bacteriophage resistance protein